MSNSLKNAAKIVQSIVPVFLGLGLGVALTLLSIFYSEWIFETGALVGIAFATVSAIVFVLVRTALKFSRSSEKEESENTVNDLVGLLFETLAPTTSNREQLTQKLSNRVRSAITIVGGYWGAAISLGFCFTALGVVITMITALAAVNQVERLDQQNKLISEQISVAFSTRSASIFATQLPTLINEIYTERAGREKWVPSNGLILRIQALANSIEPYRPDQRIEEMLDEFRRELSSIEASAEWRSSNLSFERKALSPKLFSPERAQLLQLLISVGVDFKNLPIPFSFPNADFSDKVLIGRRVSSIYENVNLGRTDLSGSNFFGTSFSGVTANVADFSGSFFSDITIIMDNSVSHSPWDHDDFFNNVGGPNLSDIIFKTDSTGAMNILNKRPKTWSRFSEPMLSGTVDMSDITGDDGLDELEDGFDGSHLHSFLHWGKKQRVQLPSGEFAYQFGNYNFFPTVFQVKSAYLRMVEDQPGNCSEGSWQFLYLKRPKQSKGPFYNFYYGSVEVSDSLVAEHELNNGGAEAIECLKNDSAFDGDFLFFDWAKYTDGNAHPYSRHGSNF